MTEASLEQSATVRGLSPDEFVRRATAVFLDKAARARRDVCEFFSFVMREEHTRKQVRVAPHQRILLEFVMAHPYSVIMLPVGCTKTYSMAAIAMFMLGNDPTARYGSVSATQGQASKILGMCKDYITDSAELRAAFPDLRPSHRRSDAWTDAKFTVERPAGIRDPSMVAVGIEGALPGSRLSGIVVDDILNHENTNTEAGREKVYEWYDTSVVSRLDPRGGRICVCNTAWHPKDLLHKLRDQGYPTLRMDVMGGIEIVNTDWDPSDPEMLRPEHPGSSKCRLTAHDPDPDNLVPLWPERYSVEYIEKELRAKRLPKTFNQLYMNICRNDDTSACKQEYVDACMARAREYNHTGLASEYRGGNLTFTGVDLAFGVGDQHDQTAFFTFELLPNGMRKILDVEIGRWPSPVTIGKVLDKAARFKSIVCVENNAAQRTIVEVALERQSDATVRGLPTGKGKNHPTSGLVSMFVEMANGAWLIPNKGGLCHPMVQAFCESCLNYSPAHHTDDVLMAAYMAREQAKKFGMVAGGGTSHMGRSGIMDR